MDLTVLMSTVCVAFGEMFIMIYQRGTVIGASYCQGVFREVPSEIWTEF